MPYTWIENEEFCTYKDVTIYHVYRHDFDNSRREFWFTLDYLGGEDDDGTFDITKLPLPENVDLSTEMGKMAVIMKAIDDNNLKVHLSDKTCTPNEFISAIS